MSDKEIKLVIGALLHDIGKVVYRTGNMGKHSMSGFEAVREWSNLNDNEILAQIKYHHADPLSGAKLPVDSLAYITYIADHISSGMDRRKISDDDDTFGFDKNMKLSSIFNRINGNHQQYGYRLQTLNNEDSINYPDDQEIKYDKQFYETVLRNITDNLKGIEIRDEYLNSLLEVMEANTSFLPSFANVSEVSDISLYDHVKLTAGIASSILKYLDENEISDYKTALWKEAEKFYDEKAFMMFSMDMSGIQSFIYTVPSDGALKSLRTRSFYLEILMEDLIDEFLFRAGLSRANLLYSGGGHAYLLLSNTEQHKALIKKYIKEVNQWFIEYFGTELYVAGGSCICSANDLGYAYGEKTDSCYKEIFRQISEKVSRQKMARYDCNEIIRLNSKNQGGQTRECKVCHRTDRLDENDVCNVCKNIKEMSNGIIKDEFFSVVDTKPDRTHLILPFGRYMVADTKENLTDRMKYDNSFIRVYGKNRFYTGNNVVTKLWVGDYINGNTFEDLAKKAHGVKRIAVMRADVDNLGKTFVSGFENKENHNKYVGLSRTTTFSRKMSMFFKHHINRILTCGEFYLDPSMEKGKRNAVIVYAGGDDVFVIGSWDDVIGFAVDLAKAFQKFTQGMLTISAGIGIYPAKYPVLAMARQTGELEDRAKQYENFETGKRKNAVALFAEDYVFSWETFTEVVLGEKYAVISRYFAHPLSRGKAFIYHLLSLMKEEREDQINLARLAYALSRLEPDQGMEKGKNEEVVTLYDEFKYMVYHAMKEKRQKQEVMAALILYVYLTREQSEGEER